MAIEGIPSEVTAARKRAHCCMRCGESDHMADNCPNPQNMGDGKGKGKEKAGGKKLHLVTVGAEMPQVGYFEDEAMDYETTDLSAVGSE